MHFFDVIKLHVIKFSEWSVIYDAKVISDVERDRYIAIQAMTSPLSSFKLLLWLWYNPVPGRMVMLQISTDRVWYRYSFCRSRDWFKLRDETWRPNYDQFSLQPIISWGGWGGGGRREDGWKNQLKSALQRNNVNVPKTLITYNSE
jgi:hypothetical protein